MNPFDQVMYLRELCVQCDFAAQAFDQLLDALPHLDGSRPREDTVLRATHSFLGHACNVSCLLWPSDPVSTWGSASTVARAWRARRRGESLRDHLGLPPEPAQHELGQPALRQHLAPFDQRLDALLARCPALAADRVVAPQDGRERLPDPQVLRYFATDTLEFIFGDEVYLLHPMALALTTVNKKAEEALAVLLEPPKLLR